MIILSFDCANRSLAVCCMTINTTIMDDISDACNEKNISKCIDLINGYTKIHLLRVFDVTKKKKTKTVERSALLKECLKKIDSMLLDLNIKPQTILVEYQMSANDKSRCVSQQIVYHYSCMSNTIIDIVGPSLKNKVSFSTKEELSHGFFMAKYASKYTANKNHCKANFLYWLSIHGLSDILEKNSIAKKNIDDASDSFMQIFGWLNYSKTRRTQVR